MFSSKFMNQFNWRNHINSSGFISTSSCVRSWLLGGVPQANRLCLLSFLQKGLFQIKLELIIFNLLKLARSASDWPAQGSQGVIAWCHLLNQRNAATARHWGWNPKSLFIFALIFGRLGHDGPTTFWSLWGQEERWVQAVLEHPAGGGRMGRLHSSTVLSDA